MSRQTSFRIDFPRRWRGAALAMGIFLCAAISASEKKVIPPGPRGKPIRPPASRGTNNMALPANAATVITLPGGVVITNIPGEFLPTSTNAVRIPAAAARKFAPLGYQPTSFTELARFFLKVPDPAGGQSTNDWAAIRSQIPEDVLAMDGKRIALAGFTLPLSLSNGRATEFLLLRTQAACCFGMVPRINEIVMVKMAPPGMVPLLDTPVVVGGSLHLKWIGDGGQLTAIYELEADKVERAH